MKVLAIDPGTYKSAYVVYTNNRIATPHKNGGFIGWHIEEKGLEDNNVLSFILKTTDFINHYVIENIQGGAGRVLGKSTIDTIRWIGKFEEAIENSYNKRPVLIHRKKVASYTLKFLEKPYPFKSVDSNIRHALINRFGDKTKGLANDMWQAFALCVYFTEVELGQVIT